MRLSLSENAAGGNAPKATVTEAHPLFTLHLADRQANFDLNLVGGGAAALPGIRPRHGQSWQRKHHQHRQRFGRRPAFARGGLFRRQGRRRQPHPVSRPRMGAEKRPRQRHHARFFPRRTKSQKLLFNEDGTPTARTVSILGHTPMGRFGEPDELVQPLYSWPAPKPAVLSRHRNPRGRRLSGADDLNRFFGVLHALPISK